MDGKQTNTLNSGSFREKIDEIYQSWQFIGVDDYGYDTYLPLSRKSIKKSKRLLEELKLSMLSQEELEEIEYIENVHKNAMRRKIRASWRVVIFCFVFIGLYALQYDVFKKPAEWIYEKEGQTLADYHNEQMAFWKNDLKETVDKSIPERKARIENLESKIEAGITNEKELKKAEKDLKKTKKSLLFYEDYLVRHTENYERRKVMTPEEYKADVISVAEGEKLNTRIAFGFYLVMVGLYIVTSRRPYFLFWKKNYVDGTLTLIDDQGASVVSSSLISSLVNYNSNSTEYIKWSDGTFSKNINLTGGGIALIIAIVLLMFYTLFIVLTLPLRIVWNLCRNYIFYF